MELVKDYENDMLDKNHIKSAIEVPATSIDYQIFPRLFNDNHLWEFNLETGGIELVKGIRRSLILDASLKKGMDVKYFIKHKDCAYVIHQTKKLATIKLKKIMGVWKK